MEGKQGSRCAVYGCLNYRLQKNVKSFFRMPKNENSLKQWIEACGRKDLWDRLKAKGPAYFRKNYLVCSDHFELKCFRNKNLFSQGLLPGSVPTLQLDDFDYMQTKVNNIGRSSHVTKFDNATTYMEANVMEPQKGDSSSCDTMSIEFVNVAMQNDLPTSPLYNESTGVQRSSDIDIMSVQSAERCKMDMETTYMEADVTEPQLTATANADSVKLKEEIYKLRKEVDRLNKLLAESRRKLRNQSSLLCKYRKKIKTLNANREFRKI